MKVFIINTLFFWTPYSYLLASSSSIKPFNQQVYIKNWLFQHYFEFRGEWDGRNWLDIAYLFLINPLQCYLNWVSLSCFILLSSQKQEVLCALCCLCRISPLASTILQILPTSLVLLVKNALSSYICDAVYEGKYLQSIRLIQIKEKRLQISISQMNNVFSCTLIYLYTTSSIRNLHRTSAVYVKLVIALLKVYFENSAPFFQIHTHCC